MSNPVGRREPVKRTIKMKGHTIFTYTDYFTLRLGDRIQHRGQEFDVIGFDGDNNPVVEKVTK